MVVGVVGGWAGWSVGGWVGGSRSVRKYVLSCLWEAALLFYFVRCFVFSAVPAFSASLEYEPTHLFLAVRTVRLGIGGLF